MLSSAKCCQLFTLPREQAEDIVEYPGYLPRTIYTLLSSWNMLLEKMMVRVSSSFMSKSEKIQTCYQHTYLLYEQGMVLTNPSLNDRLSIGKGKNNAAIASKIISDTIAAVLIKEQV